MSRKIAISINACWNFLNFRTGLIRALIADGHEVVAIAPEDPLSERLEALGCRFIPLAMDSKGLSPAHDLSIALGYRRILKAERPDVYLGYTIKPNIYGSLAAQTLGIPTINNVSGLGTAFIRRNWLTHLVSSLYRFAFRRSSTVFFQNPEDRALFVDERIVPAERARLLPGSGIDLGRFTHAPASTADSVTFLLVARLLWDKGVGEYAEAARMLRAELPDARFQLLGFLDAENRTAVPRSAVEQWQQAGLIEYLGHAEDVRPFLAAADCVVLPSYREGMPRSLLEAAATGKPLIATDVAGCRHIVEEGVNGFLCTVADAASLADAMRRMASLTAAERGALGAAARARAEAEFDERVVIDRYRAAIAAAVDAGAA